MKDESRPLKKMEVSQSAKPAIVSAIEDFLIDSGATCAISQSEALFDRLFIEQRKLPLERQRLGDRTHQEEFSPRQR